RLSVGDYTPTSARASACMLPTPSRILNTDGERIKRRWKAYGLEDLVGVYHRLGRSALATTQRVSRDRKPYLAPANRRARGVERRGSQDSGRDWPEAGEASAGRRGHDRQACHHPGLAPQTCGPEV